MKIIGPGADELLSIANDLGITAQTSESLDTAEPGEPVWILPAKYPESRPFNSNERRKLAELTESGSRICIEYDVPFDAPGAKTVSTKTMIRRLSYERFVIRQSDHRATRTFRPLDILDSHQAYIRELDLLPAGARELVTIARVAGFDTAVYGLPDKTVPGIVEIDNGIIWCSTSVSCPAFRRYKPYDAWRRLIEGLLLFVEYGDPGKEDVTDVIMRDSRSRMPRKYTVSERLSKYREAITGNLDWFNRAGMLIAADGSEGVLEGLHSNIEIDGTQTCMLHDGEPNERADCNIQTAAAFLFAGEALGDEGVRYTGENLIDFAIREFQYRDRSVYSGLWKWFRTGYESTVFYSDDNGWAGFFCLLYGASRHRADASRLSGKMAVAENAVDAGLRTAVSLRSTWGSNGHRRRRIDLPDFYTVGGRTGLRREAPDQTLYRSPHYESASMALMGLTTLVTGDPGYAAVAVDGIDDYLRLWPEGIMFQHSENDDASKFIVALLFCGAALGEKRYLGEARRLLQPFIDAQMDCGAIPDIDRSGHRYGKNRSNADYGTFESSLFQSPSDLVTDQVYGTSFMLIALYFAHRFLPKDDEIKSSLYALADYLAAIQIRNTGRSFLDGAWLRAFDPVRWEYYGAAGDWGYGPYLMETGWCQSIIDIGLSWLITDFRIDDKELEAHKNRRRSIADAFRKESAAFENNWEAFTPKPRPRTQKVDEPDVMI